MTDSIVHGIVSMAAENRYFYKSTVWVKLRNRVKANWRRQGLPCHYCGAALDWNGRFKVIVDHVIPRRQRPDLELMESNLVCVCHPCNSKKAAWDDKERDVPEIGVDGFPKTGEWS